MGDQISDCVSVCVSVYGLHVHVLYVCECVCVCMYVCVCVTSTVDNFYVCIACLCPLCETGSFWRLLVCFFYRVSTTVCVRLAPVVRLHDSRYSYGVLLCADAWPVWGTCEC